MNKESIKVFWKLGYIKLYDSSGFASSNKHLSFAEGKTIFEATRLFWRFYWVEKD